MIRSLDWCEAEYTLDYVNMTLKEWEEWYESEESIDEWTK